MGIPINALIKAVAMDLVFMVSSVCLHGGPGWPALPLDRARTSLSSHYMHNPGGLYAGTWLSTIGWTLDAGVPGSCIRPTASDGLPAWQAALLHLSRARHVPAGGRDGTSLSPSVDCSVDQLQLCELFHRKVHEGRHPRRHVPRHSARSRRDITQGLEVPQ
jgi:hypothetical protein